MEGTANMGRIWLEGYGWKEATERDWPESWHAKLTNGLEQVEEL